MSTSKCAAPSSDDALEPASKRMRDRNYEGNSHPVPSPLADQGAWHILAQFLETEMSYSEMEEKLSLYLGDRYSVDDWNDAKITLFSGEDDIGACLRNLEILRKRYIPRQPRPFQWKNIYLDIEADDGDNDDGNGGNDEQDQEGSSVAAWSPATLESRMYLLHVHRTAAVYIAEHLQGKGFPVTVSPWLPGQLYVVSDSPKTIASSLPPSHKLSVKDYHCISDEERIAVEHSTNKFPNPSWVRVKSGTYKGAVGYVFDPDQSEALLDRSHLPKDEEVIDIIRDGEIIGCSYKKQRYYRGLLLRKFHRYQLELVACPHADDIRLHVQSGFDTPFIKKSIAAFSKQFLRVGDAARIITGAVQSEIGMVVSTDHGFGGSARIELNLDGHRKELEARLEHVERVFWVGDVVRVVAGSHLGLEGHIVEMDKEIFRVCQGISMEEIQVSRYYIDRRHQICTTHSYLPLRQHFEPPFESQSIEIGDHIEVLLGEHIRKQGVVTWSPIGGTQLWFREKSSSPQMSTSYYTEYYSGPPNIRVPVAFVQRTLLLQTIKFTKEKGYDLKPGDVVKVAHGPEYQAKGIVQSIDFPKAHLILLSESDHSLIDIPIEFTTKILNVASLDSINKVISQEVFVVGGDQKGFRGTLYDIGGENCTVAINGQVHSKLKCKDIVTRYGMRLNSIMLGESDLIAFCDMRKRSYLVSQPRRCTTPPPDPVPSSLSNSVGTTPTPSSSSWTTWNLGQDIDSANLDDPSSNVDLSLSTSDPWTVDAQDIQDNIDASMEKIKESISLSFKHAKFYKRFVSTACPDPFCGVNGPAPEDCIAVFCTSSRAGAVLEHYHIPARDLSPAPPRKKTKNVSF
ncbi:uncharacterized protein F5891DRAFT_983199 [Suillus fuscotomentosus]|uniref:KOW domain-containing protein n=1 Tax=Suillus fuscotomentosus TaxID=1912939 RepID=A0AAD4DZY6_9AGAM|nr:uncharacterized protein F5891DRAFT_983199 [Suillus fuscotomentosus]KAG1896777.1 hypothetical protein F5891DRAFT_983199 [Suillus fuscotomentosus]